MEEFEEILRVDHEVVCVDAVLFANLYNFRVYREIAAKVLCADTARGHQDGKMRDVDTICICLLYTSPSPRDRTRSRMPSSA